MSGIILTSASQNPFTNTGTIQGYGYGVLADNIPGLQWNITNSYGAVISTNGKYGVGVSMTQGTLNNAGYIASSGVDGVGASVSYGAVNNSGFIYGGFAGVGVQMISGVVNNSGYIYGGVYGVTDFFTGTINNTGNIYGPGAGVKLSSGGRVVNGYAGRNFLNPYIGIVGATGVEIHDHTGTSTVANFGVIGGGLMGVAGLGGVYVDGDAAIVNGSPHNHYAAIAGYGESAIKGVDGDIHVYNYAAIRSDTTIAVSLASGFVDNIKHGAIGGGHGGVLITDGSMTNEGDVNGGSWFGVDLGAGQLINHGGIYGNSDGVTLASAGLVANYGTIVGGSQNASVYFDGVRLAQGGTLINKGLIQGPVGVHINGGTLDNAGTINGVFGAAVIFYGSYNRLILHAGAQINGGALAQIGPGNILELASTPHGSAGTITGLGSTIAGFQTVEVYSGGAWTLTGTNSANSTAFLLGKGGELSITGSLYNLGPLTLGGLNLGPNGEVVADGTLSASYEMVMQDRVTLSVANSGVVQIGAGPAGQAGRVTVEKGATIIGSGTIVGAVMDRGLIESKYAPLTITGAVTGAGVIDILSRSAFAVDGKLSASGVTFESGGRETLSLGAPDACTAALSGFGKGDAIDLEGVIGTATSFSSGTLTVTSASGATISTLEFSGPYQSGNFVLGSDGAGGTLITFIPSPPASAPASVHGFIVAMAGLSPAPTAPERAPIGAWRAATPMVSTPRADALAHLG
jgi:hypothetical protein